MENYPKYIEFSKKYIFQLESGEKKTEHLQGCLELTNNMTLSALKKKLPTAHLEPCRDWKSSIKYCQKADTRIDGPWTKEVQIERPLKLLTEFRPWQQKVVDSIEKEADDRTINWYWESEGGAGKTALAKWICAKKNACVVSGKGNDCLYAIANWQNKNDLVVIFDFSRMTEEFISYMAIEKIKDGIFFSGKYESLMIMFNSPHVLCFANFPPQVEKLSLDRWNIVHIGDTTLHPACGVTGVQDTYPLMTSPFNCL